MAAETCPHTGSAIFSRASSCRRVEAEGSHPVGACGASPEYVAAVRVRVADADAQCERCLEFQDELRQLHQHLAASGQYVTYSPGPNPGFDVEHELQRWLAVNPRSNAAAGFRAGWARMARLVGPRLGDWEARWWRSVRDNDQLRARLGSALREVARLQDRG